MKNKNWLLVLLVLFMGIAVAGGTFAYLTVTVNVTNGVQNVASKCFLIDYSVNDIGSNIFSKINSATRMTKISENVYQVNFGADNGDTYMSIGLKSAIVKGKSYVFEFDVEGLTASNNVSFGFYNSGMKNVNRISEGKNVWNFNIDSWTPDSVSALTLDDTGTRDLTAVFTLSNFKVYEAGTETQDITGTLFPSASPLSGLYGRVAMNRTAGCSMPATGELALHINSGTSTVLGSTVAAHCENATTLETYKEYTTSGECTSGGGEWITTGSALKYAIYDNDTGDGNPIKVGYLLSDDIGDEIVLYNNFVVNADKNFYYIYVWLDGYVSDNTYADLPFSAYVIGKAYQTE